MKLINFTWTEQQGVLFLPYGDNKVECIGRKEYIKEPVREGDLFMADWYASEFDYIEAIVEFCKDKINDCIQTVELLGGWSTPGTLSYSEERDRYNEIYNELQYLLP